MPADDSAPTRAAFKAQLDEEWKYWMEQYPGTATLLGYPGQNARWTDYSQAAIDARSAYLTKSLERVRGLKRAQLDARDQPRRRARRRGGAARRPRIPREGVGRFTLTVRRAPH